MATDLPCVFLLTHFQLANNPIPIIMAAKGIKAAPLITCGGPAKLLGITAKIHTIINISHVGWALFRHIKTMPIT